MLLLRLYIGKCKNNERKKGESKRKKGEVKDKINAK
jgi:hypothetical protein